MLHEVEFDGYRSRIIIDAGRTPISRPGTRLDVEVPRSGRGSQALDVQNATIDGGVVVLNEAGLSDFAALRKATPARSVRSVRLNGRELRDMALEDRQEILAGLTGSDSRIGFSETMPGEAMRSFI